MSLDSWIAVPPPEQLRPSGRTQANAFLGEEGLELVTGPAERCSEAGVGPSEPTFSLPSYENHIQVAADIYRILSLIQKNAPGGFSLSCV